MFTNSGGLGAGKTNCGKRWQKIQWRLFQISIERIGKRRLSDTNNIKSQIQIKKKLPENERI